MAETIAPTLIKERDYMFDAFRGFLLLTIPVSHFTNAGAMLYTTTIDPTFWRTSICGFIYITINVFVMQAFMFLSGYFSKNVEKAQKKAFEDILWPYLVFATFPIIAGYVFHSRIGTWFSYITPPFALWFMWCLFFYRITLKYVVKSRIVIPVSIFMMFACSVVPLTRYMALGRMFSYWCFYIIGYYTQKEHIEKIKKLKEHKVILGIMLVALLAGSLLLQKYGPRVSWFLLRDTAANMGVPLAADLACRLAVFVLASLWIIWFINVLPSKQGFLAYVGTHTMPIYMFHIALRHILKFEGMYVCFIVAMALGAVSLVSLKLAKKETMGRFLLVAAVIVAVMALAIYLLPAELRGIVPENKALLYIMLYPSAIVTGISLSAPMWTVIYEFLIGKNGYFDRAKDKIAEMRGA